ncbi:MAG: hypothetical protein KC635_04885 [Myxococcales bacterium]|nr:hypothetical protein [Myxococcales bacterium]MCB9735129.1 hypothetical protein [Deltaproteobacteria bacterium]
MAQAIIQATAGLYGFIQDHERALRGRGSVAEPLRERMRAAVAELAARFAEARTDAADRLEHARAEALRALRAFAAELEERPEHARLRRMQAALGRAYEGLRAGILKRRQGLPAGVDLRQLKPRNLARNAFHVSMALIGVFLYELVLDRTGVLIVTASLLAGFVALDVSRRLSPRFNERLVQGVFGAISRPGEAHQIPAATWYLLALFLGCLLLPQHGIELGTLVLGLGDPAASLVGKRFPQPKLLGEKSLAGSLAFTAVAFVASLALLALVQPALGPLAMVGVAAGTALAGAVAELLSGRGIDDNLTVPLVAGAVAALLLGA